VSAERLRVVAETGITLQTRVATIDLAELTGAGDIRVVNQASVPPATLTVTLAQAYDGAIRIAHYGALEVKEARTLGAGDANDIVLETYAAAAVTPAPMSVGTLRSTGRGDVELRAAGRVTQLAGTEVEADQLTVVAAEQGMAAGTRLVDLSTQVATLVVQTEGAGDVRFAQGSARLSVSDSRVADGDFTLTAQGGVW
jgi:hypothetical protein